MNSFKNTFMTVYKKRAYPNYWDLIALFIVFGIIMILARNALLMSEPYKLGQKIPISLDPIHLPGYALRTVLRMFIALFFSLLFTLTIATLAAKNKKAERIIIPFIDILQSVPILGFLSITVVAFIRLFPNSLLGPECAAIFVIFTSQAWNMALGFYQTVRSVPSELTEAATMFHLSAWQRFWRIDVPFSLPGLLWNTMVSMSAGWFFVVASEAIFVSHQQILLPGIGSYITVAIQSANMKAIGYAVLTMFIVILIYDQLLFRPLVAWSEKFRTEQIGEDAPQIHSWVISLLRRTRFLRKVGFDIEILFNRFVNIALLRTPLSPLPTDAFRKYSGVWRFVWNSLILLGFISIFVFSIFFVLYFILIFFI